MQVEQMTNEELANWMVPFTAIDDRSSGYIKSVIDEAARRLRNSIPKPVVDEFIDKLLAQYADANYEMSELGPAMGLMALQFRKDHLMEGGGDE